MIYVFEIVIFYIMLGLLWYRNDKQKYANRPPGPSRIPIFGNLLQVMLKHEFPFMAFQKLADVYGDIMFLKLGGAETVILSSQDVMKEALSHEKATGRIQWEPIRDRHNNKNLGIIWSYGKTWQNLRRFTIRNLRDYGFGKSSEMDSVINDELTKFTAHLKSQSENAPGNVIHVEDMFALTLVNVLWRLVSGKSYEYNDAKMLKLLQMNDDVFRSTNFGLDVTHAFPKLRDMFPHWAGRTLQREAAKAQFNYGKELLSEHKKLLGKQSEPQCFIAVFASKVQQSENDPDTDFTDEQFVMTILDLLVGGSETTSKTLTYGILYMLLNPEVQNKVQEELDRELPFGVPVTYSMRSKLLYTHATVLEVLRASTILPIPTAREATDDFYFRGYLIKKGTALITNVHNLHHSKALWGDPKNFRPERFFNKDGTAIDIKIADLVQSFGAGKRVCLGISLAETTLFIYFVTMLKYFRFEKVPGTNPITRPLIGITNAPYPFDVKVRSRNNARVKSENT